MGRRGWLWPLSVAPMVDCTDRHFRYFTRLLTRRTLLYTEMIATRAILDDPRAALLDHSAEEQPLAVQLGGDDPRELAACARIAADRGFAEVNLNVGCPSDRVHKGRFGACLMADPQRVADCVAGMRAAVALPVTVKHRIGIEGAGLGRLDRYEDLLRFVDTVAAAGCDRFIVHARIAILGGLSPKQNRRVPPLRHAEVHRLKAERPELAIEINGDIRTLEQAAAHLERVDGVMIGRAAYDDPFLLAGADSRLFGDPPLPGGPSFGAGPTRRAVLEALQPYLEARVAEGLRPHALTRHLLGLFAGQRGARRWRRHLGEHACKPGADAGVLREATRLLPDDVLDAGVDCYY